MSFLPLQDLKAIMMDCVFEQRLQVSKFQGSYGFFHAFTFSTVILVFTPLSIDMFSKFIHKSLNPTAGASWNNSPAYAGVLDMLRNNILYYRANCCGFVS